MAWNLDRVTVELVEPYKELTCVRAGATDLLCLNLEASGPAGTLSSSYPLPVVVGEPILLRSGRLGESDEWVYGWNGSLDAPTLMPDVELNGRGALKCRLVDGVLSPLPKNHETLLSAPVRVVARVRGVN